MKADRFQSGRIQRFVAERRERERERESFDHLVEFYGLDSPLLDDDRIVDLGIERWVVMGSS